MVSPDMYVKHEDIVIRHRASVLEATEIVTELAADLG